MLISIAKISIKGRKNLAILLYKSLSYKTLEVQISNGIQKITLNRPKKKNAFTYEMYKELADALKQGGEDKGVRIVLLTGNGDFYSSGNDLANFSKLMHPLKMAASAKMVLREFVESFILFPKPLVCAVNGPAIGIAVTTLGLCDKVLACSTSTYNTPFAALGQSPEGCSSYTFPKIMGEKIANQVLWEGRKLNAEEAKEVGLVHSVHSPDTLQQAATAVCEAIAKLDTSSIEYQTILSKRPAVEKLKQVNEEECDILEKKWVSKKCFTALANFLDSRKMTFQARVLRFANMTGFLWGQPE